MAQTFAERRKEKQDAKFIGRGEHLDLFKENLNKREPIVIFNIFGQGGVGKSYLTHQYKSIADNHDCLTTYTDEAIKTTLQWMNAVSEQFKIKEAEISEFDKRYKTYLQETKKLEADPEKPKGTFSNLLKAITKGAIKEGKKLIPAGEIIGSFIDEESISSSLGDWADFVRKKIVNKDEVELVLEPLKILSPLFWKGISRHACTKKFMCFCIDTFEETAVILEDWLLEVLDNKYGDIPANILFIIAGRNELNPNKWSALNDFTQYIPLEPFSEEEANHYLSIHGIINDNVKNDIRNLSGRLPVLMAWLVSTATDGKRNIQDSCETAVERFLKWVENDTHRNIALSGSLPRKLNKDIIECLIENKTDAGISFDWLCTQPFMQKSGTHWGYHNVVREQMLRYIRTRSHKDWVKNHQALNDYYFALQKELEVDIENQSGHNLWFGFEQERIYHALCAKPDKTLPQLVASFIKKWYDSGLASTSIIGETVQKAGKDNDNFLIKDWASKIETIQKSEMKDYEDIKKTVQDILSKNWVSDQKHRAFLYTVNGYINYEEGNYSETIECYQNAVDIQPYYPDAFYNMGDAYHNKGDYDKAIECFQKAIDIRPDYPNALISIGVAYSFKDEPDMAIAYYQKAIEVQPWEPVIFKNLGNRYSSKGDHDKAIEYYQKAIEIQPDYAEVYYNMGNVYSNKYEQDKAIECYQRAIDIQPGYCEAYYNLGTLYSRKEEHDKAIEYYQKATQIKPDYSGAYYNIGSIYSSKGEYDKAIEYFQRAIDIQPDYSDAFYKMGEAYYDKDIYDKAIECFQKTIQIKPDYSNALFFIGLIYSNKREYDLAIEYYQKTIQMKPDYAEVYYNLGEIYFSKDDPDRAIEYYQKAVQMKSDYEGAYYQMGDVYLNKGEYENAIECYQKAINIRPDYLEAVFNMANAYFNKVDYDKAIECYRKVIDARPDYENPFYNIGIVYSAKGDYDSAIEYYQKAIDIQPSYFIAYKNIAEIYSEKGEYGKEIEYYQKAIDIRPNDHATLGNLGFALLRFGELEKAHEILIRAIDSGCGDTGYMNLGHIHLANNREPDALTCYRKSLQIYNDPALFWKGIQDDFKYIQQYGIKEEYFQIILNKI
ncbi:MAG: tetratricopeptide repeat protein [Ferruginibacter sp.]